MRRWVRWSSRVAAQLWLAAELMATLDWQLDYEPGLCHRAGEFSVLTHKFEKAMAHWCGVVENALDGLSWARSPSRLGNDSHS